MNVVITSSRSVWVDRVASLSYGAAAGGLVFAVVSLVQAVLRPGFDLSRHAVSQLALGPGGAVQVLNFTVSGLLMIIGAIGLSRLLHGGRAGRAVPILLAVEGVGFLAAGLLFPADPGNGFPPGSVAAFTTTGVLHLACAGIAFVAVIAACFVLAGRIAKSGDRRWAIAGRVSGGLLAAGFLFANTGMTGGTLAMFVGASIAWLWFAATVIRIGRSAAGRPAS